MVDKSTPNIQPRYEPVSPDENPLYHQHYQYGGSFNSDTPDHSKANVGVYTFDTPKKHRSVQPSKWRFNTLSKKWRLKAVLVSFEKKDERQVPIVKDRLTAIFTAMIHLLAIVGIITLSFYIFKNYYIGKELEGKPGYDVEKKLGIQFASKLMEMFIDLSLNAITFAMVRHEFTLGQSVPYGALVAGQQIFGNQLSLVRRVQEHLNREVF
ncbi:hypothetical protein NW755_010727 [Fusarium falciforme]|uniref:Uncharacterized protein n=1 Tax=Fusarium falciforme TaxID=195108 RepID=A0A9W8R1H0_9HYPO|nr:hypothetical protein NW755_010727 [Fusarium falciforme]